MAKDNVVVRIDGDDSGFKSALKGIGTTTAKGLGIAVKGVAAVGSAFTAVTGKALSLEGSLEQNLGGSEAVFQDYAEGIQATAEKAFSKMGLSQSKYLATANKMGSLLKGVGFDVGEAASTSAEVMQRAADVASVMGIDTASAMEAVTGAAKGNFTMMDNLGVAMNETTLKAYAEEKGLGALVTTQDKVNAAMQMFLDKTADYADTYEKENATISGAISTAKASIENFLAGAGSVDDVVSSLSNAATVIINNIGELVPKLASGLTELVEKIVPMVPGLIESLLPGIFDTFVGIVMALAELAPMLIETLAVALTQNIEPLANAAVTIIVSLANTLLENLPAIIETALQVIVALATGLSASLPQLIPAIVQAIITIVDTLISNIDLLVDAAIILIMALADGLIYALPVLIEKTPEIIQKLIDAIIENAPKLFEAAGELVAKLIMGIIGVLPKLGTAAHDITMSLVDGLKTWFSETLPNAGRNFAEGLINGITGSWEWVKTQITEWCGNILDRVKEFFGIHSPARVPRDEVGKMISEGIAEGIVAAEDSVVGAIETVGHTMLESEKFYLEKAKVLDKDFHKEQLKAKLKNAKSTAEIQKLIDEAQLKDLEEKNELYLDALKDFAEREREALEERKEGVADKLDQIKDKYYDAVEEIEELKEDIAGNLFDDGENTYYKTSNTYEDLKGNSVTIDSYHLSDTGAEAKQLEEYSALIDKLYEKNGGALPDYVLSALQDMGVEEGTEYITAMLEASDEEFDNYIKGLEEKEKQAAQIAEKLTLQQTEELKTEFEKEFGQLPENFFAIGEDSAEQFGEGFMEVLEGVFEQVKASINAEISSLQASVVVSGENKGNTGPTYNNTYNVQPSSGESTQAQLQAIADTETKNEILRN